MKNKEICNSSKYTIIVISGQLLLTLLSIAIIKILFSNLILFKIEIGIIDSFFLSLLLSFLLYMPFSKIAVLASISFYSIFINKDEKCKRKFFKKFCSEDSKMFCFFLDSEDCLPKECLKDKKECLFDEGKCIWALIELIGLILIGAILFITLEIIRFS